MPTVTFTLGVDSATVRSPQLPVRDSKPPLQRTGKSRGKTRQTITWGDPEIRKPLPLRRLTDAQKDDLEDFIVNSAEYGANGFTYTDQDSNVFNNMFFEKETWLGGWFRRSLESPDVWDMDALIVQGEV